MDFGACLEVRTLFWTARIKHIACEACPFITPVVSDGDFYGLVDIALVALGCFCFGSRTAE